MSNGKLERWLREVALEYDGDECLTWPFGKNSNGYGQLKLGGKMRYAHRVICEDVNGAPPRPEHQAAHSCGNGKCGCVAKKHLSWKTRSENEADKIKHGTQARGERNGNSKFSENEIRELLTMKDTCSQKEAANRFGTSQANVWRIWRRKIWAHISA